VEETKPKKTRKAVTITLEYAIEFDGKSITEITLNRPKGKHLKKMKGDPGVSDLIGIASKCSGIAPLVFDEMDGQDITRVCEEIGNFLSGGL